MPENGLNLSTIAASETNRFDVAKAATEGINNPTGAANAGSGQIEGNFTPVNEIQQPGLLQRAMNKLTGSSGEAQSEDRFASAKSAADQVDNPTSGSGIGQIEGTFKPVNEPQITENQISEDRFDAARTAAENVTNPTRPDDQARGQVEGGFRPLNEPIAENNTEVPEDRFDAARQAAAEITNPTRPDDQARGQVEGGFRPLNEPETEEPPAPPIETPGTPAGPDGQPVPPDQQPNQPETPAQREQRERIAEAQRNMIDKANEYIAARRSTRSLLRNVWGNIKSIMSGEANPEQTRDAARAEYQMARDAYIKQNIAKDYPLPEIPENATDDEKRIIMADYDRRVGVDVLTQLIGEETRFQSTELAVNLNDKPGILKAFGRFASNPYVRMGIAGGLMASVAMGNPVGIAAFGAARLAVTPVGIKGTLDKGAEWYASKHSEKKDLSVEELNRMTPEAVNTRDAALSEMLIKRNRTNDSETAKNIDTMMQQRRTAEIARIIRENQMTGDSPENRAKVLLDMLANNSRDNAVDSRIDSNLRWNTARWAAALGATALIGLGSGWFGETSPTPNVDTLSPEVPQTPPVVEAPAVPMPEIGQTPPVVEGPAVPMPEIGQTPPVVEAPAVPMPEITDTPPVESPTGTHDYAPWRDASGDGYSWDGWIRGQAASVLGMDEAGVNDWISSHPQEYDTMHKQIMDTLVKDNPNLISGDEGTLGQTYKIADNIPDIIRSITSSPTGVK